MSDPSTIFEATASARKVLQECTAIPYDEWIENLLADLNLWSAGAGASAPRDASLDYRLESQPEVQDVIISLLCMLQTFVQRYQKDVLDSIAFQSQSHDDCESLEGRRLGLRSRSQALSEHQRSAAKVLRQLVRLTISIREAGVHSSPQKADEEFIPENYRGLQKHLNLIVLDHPFSDRYPSSERDIPILTQVQSRLVEANLRRRNRFLYAQRQSEKLAEPQEDRPQEQSSESIDLENQQTDTLPSKAPTTAVSSSAQALYPRPPLFRHNQSVFICPCCCKSLPVLSFQGSRWTNHLARDVFPYTCILEDCPRPLDLYASKGVWIKHMQDEHPRAEYWICFACRQRKRFHERPEFIKHLETEHQDGILPEDITTLISDCSRRAPLEINSCPLCPNSSQGNGEILDHIAEHVHSFSLRSLPWAPPGHEPYANEDNADSPAYCFWHDDYFDTGSWNKSAANTKASRSEDRGTEALPELDTFRKHDVLELYNLVRSGKLSEKKLDEFLQSSKIDAENFQNRTPLLEAIKGGHSNIVELLTRKGANVNKRGIHGRTPLHSAIGVRKNRTKTIAALIDAKADLDSADDDGNTPIMDAITGRAATQVVKLLVANGASTTKENRDGKSAIALADEQNDFEIKRAVRPTEENTPGRLESIATFVSFVLLVIVYVIGGAITGMIKGVISNLYHIVGNNEPDSETVNHFKENIENFVVNKNPELKSFFTPGNDFFQRVAEKAAELKEDPDNHLKSPDQINDLTRLALYQPILYCDDSGSMGTVDTEKGPNRQELLRRLVTRMCSIATRLVPDDEGVHLRFINKDQPRNGAYDSLSKDQIDDALKFEPSGGTPIGTELRNRILKPFLFDVFARGQTLKRPFLIIVITDGCPKNEAPDTFKNAIVECGRALVDKGYEPEACRFLVSRIGKDEAAGKFINALGGDIAIDRVVYRTSGPLDTKFSDLSKNEAHVEEWLLNVLMSPITGRSRS